MHEYTYDAIPSHGPVTRHHIITTSKQTYTEMLTYWNGKGKQDGIVYVDTGLDPIEIPNEEIGNLKPLSGKNDVYIR
ncbi:hypothetical protein [Neptuniibacter sp. QD37_11]|uniref:hypothetical protein n=1 Tax=Neptuniibacter sp. QD37_11 TaxID=3398209 RepID=UPI0039F463FD